MKQILGGGLFVYTTIPCDQELMKFLGSHGNLSLLPFVMKVMMVSTFIR
jgi:hypothetical protein